jgi:DNA polymerase type B, organellar and viral
VLYKVIETFNKFIFELFKLNIHDYPTLPSLAFAIFRLVYLKNAHIPLVTGQIFKDIQQAYYGGHTDMYIPYGKYVKGYDVNSLYPSVMKWSMPTAFPKSLAPQNKDFYIKEFNGDISLVLKQDQDPFGFFYVEVTCPDNLKHPILPKRFDTAGGMRTIYPTGTWQGWYQSEELNNAAKYGYIYKIFKGYLFNKQVIFIDYVDDLFKIRSKYPKEHPMNLIAKLLMNSLYGRFGMSIISNSQLIIEEKDLHLFQNKGIIKEHIELSSKWSFIILEDSKLNEEKFYDNVHAGSFKKYNNNTSIPIAATITANARVFMSQFKNNPLFKLLYTDTDSIYIIGELPPEFIGKELGKFKLENIFKEIVFISPKVYGGITSENKEITKVKGYKNKVTFKQLKALLVKNKTIKLTHELWFKSIKESNITILEQIYNLKANNNKRQLIYDPKTAKMIGTKPYKILYDQIVEC